MPTYNEVLTLVQRLSYEDQTRLLKELRLLVYAPVAVEGTDEMVSAEEIAESEAALQDYRSGRDLGLSSEALKQKLFGKKIG
ncbi:MAG: hypothetical protein HC866_05185 [Leptolyngbyaceae cyanobacterium RU_5_1]|nr:hypothetical protein [Leptolyngbyaceae cyanobacterium RU_5_1]